MIALNTLKSSVFFFFSPQFENLHRGRGLADFLSIVHHLCSLHFHAVYDFGYIRVRPALSNGPSLFLPLSHSNPYSTLKSYKLAL